MMNDELGMMNNTPLTYDFDENTEGCTIHNS
jgi:hypothetical protein